MVVDFKFGEGDIVEMIINNEVKYLVVGLTRQNGGNYYRIYDGADVELTRAEYELKLTQRAKANKSKKTNMGYQVISSGTELIEVTDD